MYLNVLKLSSLYLSYNRTQVLSVIKYFQNVGSHFQKIVFQPFFKILKKKKKLNSSKIIVYLDKKIQNCSSNFATQCWVGEFPTVYIILRRSVQPHLDIHRLLIGLLNLWNYFLDFMPMSCKGIFKLNSIRICRIKVFICAKRSAQPKL